MSIRFASGCSGIEAASVAWEPLGWKADWLAEIEPFPSTVLAHHWPDVPNLGDFMQLPSLVACGVAEAPDVFVAGTPCQSFSVAGLRKGLSDERGNLTLAYIEVINAINDRRGKGKECVGVWENVPGVLSSKDNAFGCLLAGLVGEKEPLQPAGKRWTNAGAVYGPKGSAAWRVLDAQYFGVAQRRRRVFVVSSARDGFDPAAVLFEFDGLRRDTPPSREAGKTFTHDVAGCLRASGVGTGRIGEQTGQDPVVAAPNHWGGDGPHPTLNQSHNGSIGASNQELFSQRGAGLVAQPYEPVSKCLNAGGMGRQDYETETFVCHPVGCIGGQHPNAATGVNITPTITSAAGSGGGHVPILNHVAVHGTQDPIVSINRAHALGRNNGGENAVYSFQQNASGELRESKVSYTLNTNANPSGRNTAMIREPAAVRRLTPTECARLQGFPDDHCRIPWRGKPAELCPDGPQYKAYGNSMAVPVMHWIGGGIQKELLK